MKDESRAEDLIEVTPEEAVTPPSMQQIIEGLTELLHKKDEQVKNLEVQVDKLIYELSSYQSHCSEAIQQEPKLSKSHEFTEMIYNEVNILRKDIDFLREHLEVFPEDKETLTLIQYKTSIMRYLVLWVRKLEGRN